MQGAGAPTYSTKAYANSFPVLSQPNSSGTEVGNAIIRTGAASVKEDSLRLFPIWNKRWLVLTGSELQIYKNEVSQSTIPVYFVPNSCSNLAHRP